MDARPNDRRWAVFVLGNGYVDWSSRTAITDAEMAARNKEIEDAGLESEGYWAWEGD